MRPLQHLFNLRIDPAIDGYRDNSVVYDDVFAMKRDERNPHGVGFEVKSTTVEKESAFNLDWTTNRGESPSSSRFERRKSS
jgi:primary-amine oxidase